MKHLVLGVGYTQAEYEAAQREWLDYGVVIDLAESAAKAIEKLKSQDYACVVLDSRVLDFQPYIDAMRQIRAIPILVITPEVNAQKRAQFLMRYVVGGLPGQPASVCAAAVDRRFAFARTEAPPPTIITDKDLYFCLEHREVLVRGQEVKLTRKEFELLRLLITHPLRVYTFEVLFGQVWGEEYTVVSKKTVINHMGNLRRKLKVDPGGPDYIINIHGIGYKYDTVGQD